MTFFGRKHPDERLKDATQGSVRVVPRDDTNDAPLGSGWNFRLHFIYIPVFTLLNFIFMWTAVTAVMEIFFPKAQGSFLSGGGISTTSGNFVMFLAFLPLAAVLSRFVIWFLMVAAANDVRYHQSLSYVRERTIRDGITSAHLTTVSHRAWFFCLLLTMMSLPVIYADSSRYFSLSPDQAIVGPGNFHFPHHHPWSDLFAIKAGCKSGGEGKSHVASYVMSFEGGDTVDIPLAEPARMEDFLPASRKLAEALKNKSFTFVYDGDPDCPARWLPALSVKPGDARAGQ